MKKTLCTVLLLVFFLSFTSIANSSAFQTWVWALKQFEKSIKYEAQSASWKRKRAGWLARMRSARSGQGMTTKLLIELETSVKWSYQSSYWKKRRSAWIRQVRAARYIKTAAPLLLEIERLAKWNAHYSWWRNARNKWKAQVRSLMR